MAYTSKVTVWLCKFCEAGYIRAYHANAHVREAHGFEPREGLLRAEVELQVRLELSATVLDDRNI